MFHRWLKFYRWLVPDPSVSLERQFFQGLCLLSGLLAIFVVIPIDLLQSLSPWVNRGVFGFGLVSLGLGWAARRGRHHKKTMILAFLALLDFLWFPNGGSQGSIGLYFSVAALYLVLFFEGAARFGGLATLMANILGLLLVEHAWPRTVTPFPTPAERIQDLASGYLISLLMCGLILWVVLDGFNRERRRGADALEALRAGEERYRLLSEKLSESEARMAAVFDSTADFIWSVDAGSFRVMTFNARLREFFLASRGIRLRVGMPQEELFPPGPYFDLWQHAYRRALAEGSYTMEYATHSGRETLRITFNLLESEGKVFGISAFGRDISERLRLEAAQKELEAQIRQIEKLDSLGSLAGGVAHDMNNVLGAILGLASTHQLQAKAGSALGRDMETITRACQRGGALVKGLLGFARKSLAEERVLDLNALVREQVALLERTTLQKIHLSADLAEGLPPLSGDPAALTHALMNLCVNAVDAMPEGGALTLCTRGQGDGTLLLEVADTGCGMSQAVLDKALDPFFTTKPQGRGTGLGLSIVFATVKAHHGRMEIKSEPGRGTRVLIWLPALPAAAPAGPAVQPPLQPARRTLHVLLVDDDELIREAVRAVLEVLGHRATVVAGGEEALARLEAGLDPDVVVLDMNMPGLDGAGTMPRLRRLAPRVPVLLATGRTDQAALALVAAHPGVTLLPKPFNTQELQQKLESAAI